MKIFRKCMFLFMLLGFVMPSLQAQYFGRNKPRYQTFDFKVLETPHFQIYNYLEDTAALHEFASWSEHWYDMHQAALRDTFTSKNPIVLYNNHADFQQTNTIMSSISVGTGGVTEAFKNRVVLPMAMSRQQTHHVLGHEMVHAFQYHLILQGDSTSLQNLQNLPLWMVEGLAEYMSIGRVDAHTAMWMRDAVLNDDVPTIKDLSKPKYFPYRYGQVFWAFITGIQGDDIIEPLFVETAKQGLEKAIEQVLNMKQEDLSELWVEAIKREYNPYVEGKKETPPGRKLLSPENSGRINIAPVLSPNGRYMIFLSEKNLFSIDLFLADASTGEIIRQVASTAKSGHIDDFDYIESAGTWSPDSRRFAFVAYKQGRNILVINDAFKGKNLEEFPIKDVPAFKNPTWSPDGRSIVVSGLVDGQVDLYQVDVRTKRVSRLTEDKYTEMLPSWSPDGSTLVFATDRLSQQEGRNYGKWTFNLATMDMVSGRIENIGIFREADNLNPVYDQEGNIWFLSNRDGFRNIYKYEPSTEKVYRMSDLLTGVSGITHYAPALSATRSERLDRIAFSHYYKNGYNVYSARHADFEPVEVDPDNVDMTPAILPKLNKHAVALVDANLQTLDSRQEVSRDALLKRPYKPKFQLDYIGGSAGVGVGNTNFGTVTGAAGGVDMLFSDMLGNNQFFSSISLNGEILDFGGVMAYINRKNRIGWGVTYSHLPYRSILNIQRNFYPDNFVFVDEVDIARIFEDKVGVFAQYPFSTTLRLEAGANYSFYYNRLDRLSYFYNYSGFFLGQDREKIDPDEYGVNIIEGQVGGVNLALVGDNSYFGMTAPLRGYRFRLAIERNFNGFGGQTSIGGFNFYNLTADYRYYKFLRPVTVAARIVHFGRYGADSETLFPLYLGYPWYIRGYNFNQASEILPANGKSLDILIGSKILVSGLEVRLPFTGPKQLALINSNILFTDLNLFLDGGLAWRDFEQFSGGTLEGYPRAEPVFSAGVSLRINLFGAMILEPFYAVPLQKETKGAFGLNIVPGW